MPAGLNPDLKKTPLFLICTEDPEGKTIVNSKHILLKNVGKKLHLPSFCFLASDRLDF